MTINDSTFLKKKKDNFPDGFSAGSHNAILRKNHPQMER